MSPCLNIHISVLLHMLIEIVIPSIGLCTIKVQQKHERIPILGDLSTKY